MKTLSASVINALSFFILVIAVSLARSEQWPTLESYVSKCVLIVKASAVVEKDNRLSFRALESWKGKYDPELFVRVSPEGRFFANRNEHGVDVVNGQEIVFFFTRHNQPPGGKLRSHSTAFPIKRGKLVYASTSLGGPEGLP